MNAAAELAVAAALVSSPDPIAPAAQPVNHRQARPRPKRRLPGLSLRRGWRCWRRTDPSVHYAFYEFVHVAQAEALIGWDKIKPVVADFDRVWGDRVSRHREVLEIVPELTV